MLRRATSAGGDCPCAKALCPTSVYPSLLASLRLFVPLHVSILTHAPPSQLHPSRLLLRSLRAKGRKGKALDLQQPWMRKDYVYKMLGRDLADQQNGSHTHDHKSYTNFWRRVFDAKIEQSLTNGFLVFRKWVELLTREVKAKMPLASGEDLPELDVAAKELERLSKVERAVWDEEMATLLMAKCDVGKPNKGGRPPASDSDKQDPVERGWGSISLKNGRVCLNPICKTKSNKGCSCKKFCTRGDVSGVLMCLKCSKNPESHKRPLGRCVCRPQQERNRMAEGLSRDCSFRCTCGARFVYQRFWAGV